MRPGDLSSPERSDPDPGASGVDDEAVSYPMLVLPLAAAILFLTVIFFFRGGDVALEIVTTALITVTVAGKFIVVRGIHDGGFFDSPYKLAILVSYLDMSVAAIAVYNVSVLYRIPRFGEKIRTLRDNGVKILTRNPWMRKWMFVGIIAFVMFPLSGTGAIGGALFGRLLGMKRGRTMIGIAIGALLGSFSMAALADAFSEQMSSIQESPIFSILGLLAVGAVIYWLIKRYRRMS